VGEGAFVRTLKRRARPESPRMGCGFLGNGTTSLFPTRYGVVGGSVCRLTSGNLVEPRPREGFCRAMLCIIAPYAVVRCLSVRLASVTFVYCVETIKHILKLFSPLGSLTILVFLQQTLSQYFDGDPLTVAWNVLGLNRDFRPVSRFISEMIQDRARVTVERR